MEKNKTTHLFPKNHHQNVNHTICSYMVLFSCTNLALSGGIEYTANPNETLVSLDILQILCKYCVILEVFFSLFIFAAK